MITAFTEMLSQILFCNVDLARGFIRTDSTNLHDQCASKESRLNLKSDRPSSLQKSDRLSQLAPEHLETQQTISNYTATDYLLGAFGLVSNLEG